MKKLLNFLSIILLIFLIFSCSNPLDDGGRDDPAGKETGTINISIPEYAPWINTTRATATSDNLSVSKAWLVSSTVDFTLYNSSGTYVDDITVAAGVAATGWEVTVHTGYTIKAEVYNGNVSTTVPVVTGVSSPFTVTAGNTTTVTVTCFPYNPVSLTEGVSSSPYNLNSWGEKWFSVTPTTANTIFTVTSINTSDTGIYVFGSDGLIDGYIDTTNPIDSVQISTTPGATYYIGIIEWATTSDTFTVLAEQYDPTDDMFEENDTMGTAATGLFEDTWYYNLIQADDDWYIITVTAAWNRVQIDCRFTDADGDIDIALYDSAGVGLASSTSTTDNEYIDYVVDPAGGTYYIRVYYDDAGNEYDLWWDDIQPNGGTGFIDVEIQ